MDSFDMTGFNGMEAMPILQCHQADGGPDENIAHLRTQTLALASFLLSGTDSAPAIHGTFLQSTQYLFSIFQ